MNMTNRFSTFVVKFGNVLPYDKRVFKCSVNNFNIDGFNIDNEVDTLHVVPDEYTSVPLNTVSLTANFSFVNYYSSTGESNRTIALYDYYKREMYKPIEFYVENFNQQEIEFKLLNIAGMRTEFLEPYERWYNIILNLESAQ